MENLHLACMMADIENPEPQEYRMSVVDTGCPEEEVYIELEGKDTGLFLELCIRIKNGVPTVTVWGTRGDDSTCEISRTEKGLVIQPAHDLPLKSYKEKDGITESGNPSYILEEENICPFCDSRCFDGDGCEEWNNREV